MTPTARITKDLHVHKPICKMIMTYADKEGRKTQILDMADRDSHAIGLLIRTIKWAARNGVEITLRPL